MMICSETFYEMNLKGKTAEQIMTVIRSLKREIGRLKNIAEHPDYVCTIHPSECVRISCSRDYLERAKQALEEAGGTYIPSAAEKKAMEFDSNIPYINKVSFCIGGFLSGYESKTYIIDGDIVRAHVENSTILTPSPMGDFETEEINKEYFLNSLKYLHIGEWRKHYNTERYGIKVLDGTQWKLEIYFYNGYKPVEICGDNAYPYNFDRALELFEVKV